VLYERLDKSGKTCRYAGINAGLDAPCDDMARAISLETDTLDTLAQEEADKARRRAEVAANDPGFAPNIERDRAKAKAELGAGRGVDQTSLDRLEALSEAMYGTLLRAQQLEDSAKAQSVMFQSTDSSFGQYMYKFGETQEMPSLGATWNDEIEVITITDPAIKVIGFEHENFRGRQIELTCGEWELIGDPENEISSIKIIFIVDGQNTYCPPGRQEVRQWTR
jgi:hypothetical protein